jgi:galactose mutarotase-like enzyme
VGAGAVPPTGRQFELRCGSALAVVTEVGATLRALEIGGQPFVDGFGADELPDGSQGQVLMPFPNRVGGGRYRFGDAGDQQLPIEEPETGNAIHGLVRWANWQPLSHTGDRLVMGLVLHARNGYPFVLSLQVAYTLLPDGLRVRHTAQNAGAAAAPYGAGFHPYLTLGSARVDGDLLRVPAASWLPVDPRSLPTGTASVDGTPFDFREPRPIGAVVLDTGYTDLLRDPDGLARVTLAASSGQARLTVFLDGAFGFLQVYTGDTLGDPAARRRSLAVEPCTCATDAFNNGMGLRVLQPGETTTGVWGISVAAT